MAGRDITEGRATRAIAVDVGVVSTTSIWQNTDVAYDVAIGGMPFIYAISDARPYIRQTAPFRKEQFDNQTEPGEQSLTGWWIRSQQSFHGGDGITFYDPAQTTSNSPDHYRFADSRGIDVWTQGKVTLLNDVTNTHQTTGPIVGTDHQHTNQHARSIQWNGCNGVLLHDEFDVDKIYPSITVSITNKALTTNVATLTTSVAHGLTVGMTIVITDVDATFNGSYRITGVPTTTTFTYAKVASDVTSTAVSPVGTGVTDPVIHYIDYISGTDRKVFAICDDGINAYWITNKTAGGNQRLTMFKKPLTGDSTTGSSNPNATGDVTQMFQSGDIEIQYATMEFIKDRIILCVNNRVYELATTATSLPSPVYTNPNTNYHYTSVAASGPAIYTAGHSGIYSTIQKYTLSTAGVMPTLTSAVVAAELPAGEIVEKLYYYLGYMCIGTNKGIRVATVSDQDGSITYGPLILETSQPVYDFAGRDRFIWAATGVGALDGGLTRFDLSLEVEPLRFAYANDVYVAQSTEHYTTAVAFVGTTNRIAFTTAHNTTDGAIYLESAESLPSGYLQTGYIRYNTLEPKNFKRLVARGDYTYGSMTLETVTADGTEYDVVSYDSSVPPVEVTTSNPQEAQEYLAYKFILYRDGSDATKGPIMEGYQAKATIATPRQRVMRFPVYCYDVETDRYNVQVGYEGRAFDRIAQLESVEENGDVVTWQDLTTGESRQAVIEQISFTRLTPPDRGFTGYGGVIDITIRTV
ncbi:MAG: hypothetical protein EHM12_11850 [Dehalococcoidia bacterium]|nr:MAG: hypothetical protein EHM12_11850 [Dehalococcoidia bacterium]